MADTMDDAAATAQGDDDVNTDTPDTQGAPDDQGDPDGADQLGDPGKKALQSMKAREKQARAKARELEQELEQLRQQLADKDKSPDEQAVEAARREAAAEAAAKANERILRSEIKAAAAGKLRDPADALRLLDLSEFEVGDDGEVDPEQIEYAISDLLKVKPYLAAQSGSTQFDSGRGKRATPSQLTRADIKTMSPQEIKKARAEGRLDRLMSGKS